METWLYKFCTKPEIFKDRGFRQCWKDMQYFAEKYGVDLDVFVYDPETDKSVCYDDRTEEVH